MKKRKQTTQTSPLNSRLLKFWLPLFLLILAAAYWSQARYNPTREAKLGLDKLNQWRKQSGLQPLAVSSSLHKAALNHAKYLSEDADGHDERNRRNPHYTGATPQERATAVGYAAPIVENLSIGNFARSGTDNINGLMTALYHRLALLHPEHDEAGAAWVNGKNQAFVVKQGSSLLRQLCEQPAQGQKRYVLTLSCNGRKTDIPLNQPLPEPRIAVKFPMGKNAEPEYDGTELPNPMPNYKRTGNPVSIAFYGQGNDIQMKNFQLFAPDGEIRQTKILTANSDPNRLLQPTEFALFPIEPLAFDTEYRAEFRYRQNGQDKTETWTFRTREKRHWFE